MKRKSVEIGATYKGLHVLAGQPYDQKNGKKYTVRCLLCGCESKERGQLIVNPSRGEGCRECRAAAEQERRRSARVEEARKHIGERHGNLTMMDTADFGTWGKNPKAQLFGVFKCECGNVIERPVTVVLHDKITSCGHDRDETLKRGQEKNKELHIGGSYLKSFDGSRTRNRNNSTGVTGVSRRGDGYRAYITFRGKQYHLGVYTTLEKAAEVRKRAEKHCDDFLKWYTENENEIRGER